MSIEELIHIVNECNYSNGVTGCVLGSMDRISLYPPIDMDFVVEKCMEIICETEVEFHEVITSGIGPSLKINL